jgi:dihydrofolate reductase
VKIAIIAAIAHNMVIGKAGVLPWHIPEDLKHFKSLTRGHAVLMGRKTWQSLGRPLPERRNVVLTSGDLPGVEHYATLEAALVGLRNEETVFIIGGAKLYAQLLDRADFLYLTLITRDFEGDTFFPAYRHLLGTLFVEASREEHAGFAFVDYHRVSEH